MGQPATIGALAVPVGQHLGIPVAYQPRLSMRRIAYVYPGTTKTGEKDACIIAAAALPIPVDKLRCPRWNEAVRQSSRIQLAASNSIENVQTLATNSINSLVWFHQLRIVETARRESRQEELSLSIARSESVRRSIHILDLRAQLDSNEQQLAELVKVRDEGSLLHEAGLGPVMAAQCIVASSHENQIRAEAFFAALAGVILFPASSGNTVHHRLNHGGERALNSPLHMVVLNRMFTIWRLINTWRNVVQKERLIVKSVVASNAIAPIVFIEHCSIQVDMNKYFD